MQPHSGVSYSLIQCHTPTTVQEYQSKDLPNSRIQPDRRWFGNTRVIGQKQLEQFREEMTAKARARDDALTPLAVLLCPTQQTCLRRMTGRTSSTASG